MCMLSLFAVVENLIFMFQYNSVTNWRNSVLMLLFVLLCQCCFLSMYIISLSTWLKEEFDVVALNSLINCAPYCFSVYNFNLFCLYDHNAPKI